MDKILVFSYHFPPELSAQGIIVYKYIYILLKQGYKIDVISASREKSEKDYFDYKMIDKIRLKFKNSFSLIKLPNGKDSRINELIFGYRKQSWTRKAVNLGNKLTKENDYELILSFALPIDSHIAASIVSQDSKLPLILHYADPFSNNPLFKKIMITTKQIRQNLELKLNKNAKKILFTNERLVPSNQLNMEKCKIMPHPIIDEFYDIEDVEIDKTKFLISYAGGFSKKRPAKSMCIALEGLNPKIKKTCKVLLIGSFSDKVIESFLNTNIEVETTGSVGYFESLAYMSKSNLLVSIDPYIKNCPFLPSKLVDYLGAKIPVLAISPSNSYVSSLGKRIGFKVIDNSDIVSLTRFIAKTININSFSVEYDISDFKESSIKKIFKEVLE